MLLHYKNLGIVSRTVSRAGDMLNAADLQDGQAQGFPTGSLFWLPPRGAVQCGAPMCRFQAGVVYPRRNRAFRWTRLSPWVRTAILPTSPGNGHKHTARAYGPCLSRQERPV